VDVMLLKQLQSHNSGMALITENILRTEKNKQRKKHTLMLYSLRLSPTFTLYVYSTAKKQTNLINKKTTLLE
jgi:hypothetical protein